MDKDQSQKEDSEPEAKPEAEPAKNDDNNLKNISPYMSKDLIAAAGFNVETPIVSAIIGNLTGSLPTKKSETEMIKCEICDCELSSNVVLNLHLNGSRHKKRLKALEIIAQLKDGKDKGVQLGDIENPNAFRCEICLLTVNSAQQLEVHLSGAKHKKKAAKAGLVESDDQNEETKNTETNENSADSISPPTAKKKKKEEPKVIPCDICNVFMNSKIQYDQHLVSKKHLNKVNPKQTRILRGRGKFIRFPQFRRAETQYPNDGPKESYQNNSVQQHNNPQTFKRMFPSFNFPGKQPPFNNSTNGFNNRNSFRQSPGKPFQRKF